MSSKRVGGILPVVPDVVRTSNHIWNNWEEFQLQLEQKMIPVLQFLLDWHSGWVGSYVSVRF